VDLRGHFEVREREWKGEEERGEKWKAGTDGAGENNPEINFW